MSTTDVHRQIDNKLPEGKRCENVTVYEVYTATIDGNEVAVSVEVGTFPDDIAARIVAEVGTTANAQVEGAEAPEAPEDEAEHDDSDDEDADAEAIGGKPKSKSKSKSKK